MMRNKFLSILMAFVFLAAMGSSAMAATMYQGQPSAFNTGTAAGGYHVWQDGGRWYVQTVNAGTQRQFTGKIETDGTFSDVSTLSSDKGENVMVNVRNEKIEFNINSQAKSNGFSFAILNSQNATFTLYVDGQPVNPANVYLGQQNRHPVSYSFPINVASDSFPTNVTSDSSIGIFGPSYTSRFQGQPTAFNPGSGLGYFIWQDGDRWFLKTTAQGAQRQLAGIIRTGGTFAGVSRLGLEDNDMVRINESRNEVIFDLKTESDQDGLSFQLSGGADATFTLYLDGQPVNLSNVYLGSQNLHPTTQTFNLSSRDDQYTRNDFDINAPIVPATIYQTIVSANAQGEPTELNSGKIFGYFIWQDLEDRWFVQATTTGEKRHFTGTIETSGALSDVKTLSSQRSGGTVVNALENKISFAFTTGGSNNDVLINSFANDSSRTTEPEKMSGLSFRVNDGANLKIKLFVDGQPVDPSNIYLGSENKHSSSSAIQIYSSNQ